MNSGTRIIYNTGVLYIRLLIGMAVGLFTVRLVLGALGETNYGIYSLVAGVVGMLGVINGSMANASMRFMAHSLGSGDVDTIRKTFNTTLILHFVIGAILIILMEVGGWLMFEYFLNIPEGKIFDAKIVFHFMVITTFVMVISVPYDAVINSHENLLALSIVDVLGYILKLGGAIYLTYSDANLLILYGFYMLVIQILLRVIKQWYSRVTYKECKINFRFFFDKNLAKTIFFFTFWNLFGNIAAISVTQVRGILLNMFFGVNINAADGISRKANDQVNTVSVSMTQALNPQLVKSEGSGNRLRMLNFTEMSTKFSIFLFALFAIPVIIETPYLLKIWLKDVPEFAVIFCQLMIINSFLGKFSFEITSAIRAVGNIKNFQVTESILAVLTVPISYVVFKMGYPPYSILLVNLFIGIFATFARLYFGKIVAGMDIKLFLKNGIVPTLMPLMLGLSTALIPHFYLPQSFLRLCISTIVFMIVITTSFWFFGLKAAEAKKLKQIANSAVKKIFIKH